MKIELFNTWEEKWNRIPEINISKENMIRDGESTTWVYFVWIRDQRTISYIRVDRETVWDLDKKLQESFLN